MTRIYALLLLCLVPAGAFAATDAAPAAPAAAPAHAAAHAPGAPKSEDDKVLYAIGEILSANVKPFELSAREMQLVQAGFAAGLHDPKSAADADTYRSKIQALLGQRAAVSADKAKAAGKSYREKAAAAKGAMTLPSGVIVTPVKAGTGATPTADDQVKVHYEGRLIDGTVFDSSIQRGQPATFPLKGVVPCWTEGLQHVSVGGKIKLICPPEAAYGDRGSPPKIPGGSTLVFDVELLDIVKAAPAAPAEPAAPAAPATPAPAADGGAPK